MEKKRCYDDGNEMIEIGYESRGKSPQEKQYEKDRPTYERKREMPALTIVSPPYPSYPMTKRNGDFETSSSNLLRASIWYI